MQSERLLQRRETLDNTILDVRLHQGLSFSNLVFASTQKSARALPETPHCSPKIDIRKTMTWYATECGSKLLVHDRTTCARSSGARPPPSPVHFPQDGPLEIQGHKVSSRGDQGPKSGSGRHKPIGTRRTSQACLKQHRGCGGGVRGKQRSSRRATTLWPSLVGYKGGGSSSENEQIDNADAWHLTRGGTSAALWSRIL